VGTSRDIIMAAARIRRVGIRTSQEEELEVVRAPNKLQCRPNAARNLQMSNGAGAVNRVRSSLVGEANLLSKPATWRYAPLGAMLRTCRRRITGAEGRGRSLRNSWPVLLVQIRQTGEYLWNSYSRFSSCDEHHAVIKSCCRVKETPGSHRTRRRELVGCRIEHFGT
jgi:hypothetical protein